MKNEGISKSLNIRVVENPITVEAILPSFHYQFDGVKVLKESEDMYKSLVEFLKTNEELIPADSYVSKSDYIKGFQKSLSLVRLWIDSMYIEDEEE